MRVIIMPRGAGKTPTAIEIVQRINREDGYALLACIDPREVRRVWALPGVSDSMPMPITHQALMDGWFDGRNVRAIVIDDADALLRRLCRNVRLAAVTMDAAEAGPTGRLGE